MTGPVCIANRPAAPLCTTDVRRTRMERHGPHSNNVLSPALLLGDYYF